MQNHKRLVHTLGVAYTAAAMAMRYHYDNVDRAMLAGLMHDVAKCIPDEEKIRRCDENYILLSDIERNNPKLIHAKLGALIAEEDYWIHDVEILNAIRTHTTGAPNMTMLQKIIYVADLIEPNRDDIIPHIDRLQELAFTDLDMAVYKSSELLLNWIKAKNVPIDPMTERTYEFYKNLIEERG
ncbi:MAG: HD domain-containing protein [Parasporobacterium sp.]|nr:HD domain-containing protein [Parasporobacterium sp.]